MMYVLHAINRDFVMTYYPPPHDCPFTRRTSRGTDPMVKAKVADLISFNGRFARKGWQTSLLGLSMPLGTWRDDGGLVCRSIEEQSEGIL